MPQFQSAFYTGQIFWMLISFGLLFLWITFIIFPMFQDIFNARQMVIQTHLKQAERINKQAENLARSMQEKRALAEKERADVLAETRLAEQDAMQNALDKNQRKCNDRFKQTIQKIQTVEDTLSSAMNDWTNHMQRAFITKTKPTRRVK